MSQDAAGQVIVSGAFPDSGVAQGDRLLACDGENIESLMARRVYNLHGNPDLPHTHGQFARFLVVVFEDDVDKMTACTFESDSGKEKTVVLSWREWNINDWNSLRDLKSYEPSLDKIENAWFLTLPTFNFPPDSANKIHDLLALIEAQRSMLRAAPLIVLDVRGNGGGNSYWATQVLTTLYGEELVDAITSSFDWTVDFRASLLNARLTRQAAEASEASGNVDGAAYRRKAADAMEAAFNRGENFARLDGKPTMTDVDRSTEPSPFSGRVYLLTDERCASACLDFADIALRLPGVTHIGGPTAADAVYIDIVMQPLPTGRVILVWSIKKYLDRVRGHNEYYSPEIVIPTNIDQRGILAHLID